MMVSSAAPSSGAGGGRGAALRAIVLLRRRRACGVGRCCGAVRRRWRGVARRPAASPLATPRRAARLRTPATRAHADHTRHMPRDESGEGRATWLGRWWRALLAELLATALLVWLGVAAMMPVRGPGTVALAHPAMAFGFVVVANACAFGPVSGAHMNPAVTLAALLYGQIGPLPALGYVLAQMLGALLGFGALLGTTPAGAAAAPAGCTLPAPHVSAAAAALLEAALTGVLALACCGVWSAHDAARPDPAAPIKLGLVVAGLVYAGGHATGASINPARSFAPALLHGHWEYQWVYWAGPLGGAALAALLHRYVLTRRPCRALHAPEDLPLQDKTDHV